MNRIRIVAVLTIAITCGGGLAYGTYNYLQNVPVRTVTTPTQPVVIARTDLLLGTELKAEDLRAIDWPVASVPEGTFSDSSEIVGRGLIVSVVRSEPILPGKLASPEAGSGLPPIIPAGMRAVSVRVNEVIGVAGYVLPGTYVDVLATASPTEKREDTTTKVVLTNVQVLAAGIITMFDPVNHDARSLESVDASVVTSKLYDRRWERIRRPVVIVGGELTLDMLDLTFNPIAKYYEAPIQLKANGGVFVIDDFGRQRVPPRDLLNRWIVPLESRVDYLTLHTGRKFEVPFEALIIFATNLQPDTLADEAFLRRIPYKILAKNPTFDEFVQIFDLNCRRHQIRFDPVIVEYLERQYYKPRKLELRACHPRDLVEQMVALCRYRGCEPAMSRELLDTVCRSYFLEHANSMGSPKTAHVGELGPISR